jgi:ferredoxin--NADP+ reductase
MGAAYATDLLYDQAFIDMAARHPRFTYLTAISREQQRDGQGPMYVQNRVRTNADLIVPLLEGERTLVYICGLAGMELGILQEMARRLSPSALEQYVHADAAALANVAGWERRMLHKEVKPTRRVFLEVY